jgi:glycosyltransferase involved in cell wall biosynthesis
MPDCGQAELDVDDSGAWLKSFERERGRKLRVLHIGNIANNAYNNAKIQRARGIDADVLSFDYYHIMATPEWEDADFVGTIKDDYFPDWWALDLQGFRRPRWFVAGPLDASIRYLLAKTAGSAMAGPLWHALECERWLLSRRGRAREAALKAIALVTGQEFVGVLAPANSLLMRAFGRHLCWIGGMPLMRATRLGQKLRHRGDRLVRHARTASYYADRARQQRVTAKHEEQTRARMAECFAEIGRTDAPHDFSELYTYWFHPYFRLLLQRYDIVQGYATYTAMPYIIGLSDYVAYEHGTIRSIPFEDTHEGQMCLASYHAADAVLVTNLDNLAAAQRMKLDPQRLVCLPHAFDSDKLLTFARQAGLPEPGRDRPVTFVTPTRQHWRDNDPGWAKGNDRVFAALRMVKDSGRFCMLRAVAWGKDLEASRALVAELGIADMVEWLPTMKKRELWLEYLKAHAVIDQFLVPAFGGVTFEAMILARRVITSLDAAIAARFFGVAPPLFACQTADEIAAAMMAVIDDPQDATGRGRANQEWMQRYHSADRIVAIQLDLYRRLIAARASQAVATPH